MTEWYCKRFSELSTQELYEILSLRIAVFVVEQNAAYQDCDGKDIDSYHFFGMQDEKIIAYSRLIPAGITYTEPCLGRVVVDPLYRRQKTGYQMVYLCIQVMEKIFETSACRISAQEYLLDFYSSFGFKAIGDLYLEDGLPHKEMLKL